jgi:hypothetical protein
MKIKKNKWFEDDGHDRNVFISIKVAETVRQAFEKSILKWELIVKGWDTYNSIETCGLCDLYFEHGNDEESCVGCPIFERTGEKYCGGSPYNNYVNEYNVADGDTTLKLISCSMKELSYLIKLGKEYINHFKKKIEE